MEPFPVLSALSLVSSHLPIGVNEDRQESGMKEILVL